MCHAGLCATCPLVGLLWIQTLSKLWCSNLRLWLISSKKRRRPQTPRFWEWLSWSLPSGDCVGVPCIRFLNPRTLWTILRTRVWLNLESLDPWKDTLFHHLLFRAVHRRAHSVSPPGGSGPANSCSAAFSTSKAPCSSCAARRYRSGRAENDDGEEPAEVEAGPLMAWSAARAEPKREGHGTKSTRRKPIWMCEQ